MRPSLRALLLAVALPLAGCGSPLTKEQFCFDGKDDDENGLVDCADPQCAAVPGCGTTGQTDGGGQTGTACADQVSCLTNGDYDVRPIPMCVGGFCATPTMIKVRMTVNGQNYAGVPAAQIKSMLTRIVSKRAIDGSTVTCDTLKDAAPSKLPADADQLVRTKRFNILSYDILPLSVSPGQSFEHSRLYTNVGKDFLIWAEIWGGGINGDLPTGNRAGWSCKDNEAELVASDDIDSGGNRDIALTLATPQP